MISVVIPVFNSQPSLEELTRRLAAVLEGLDRDYELILVDDASSDESWRTLRELATASQGRIRVARSAVNRGQHNALLCGFSLVRGEVVVTMDDDLQNPPEEVAKLLEALDDGYDLVVGAYSGKRHSRFRNAGGALIDALQRRIFGLPKGFQLTSFRAVRRSVTDHALQMGGAYPYITAMLLANSSRRRNVDVRHEERRFGSSGYSLPRSLHLALSLLIGYSSYPLYLVASLCALGFLFSAGFGAVTFWMALAEGTFVQGWASTVVILTFFNSLNLFCLLIFGVYLSRLSSQLTGTRTGFRIDEVF